MCGRLEYDNSNEVAKRLGVNDNGPSRDGDKNAPPHNGRYVFGIRDNKRDELTHFHWPLVPSWEKGFPKYNTSNAMSEDMHNRASYKQLLGKRHCIIVVNAFYEWKRTPKGKTGQAFKFTMADGSQMKYAGLWDYNHALNLISCTIITREPNEIIGEVHDRMPVILTDEQVNVWLNTAIPYEERAKVLVPIENSYLLRREVGKSVGKRS